MFSSSQEQSKKEIVKSQSKRKPLVDQQRARLQLSIAKYKPLYIIRDLLLNSLAVTSS